MNLETKHQIWILDEAIDGFVKRIGEMETEITRHNMLRDEPYTPTHLGGPTTRAEQIARLRDYLDQYRGLVVFCRDLRDRATDMSAMEFAKAFASYVADNYRQR